MTLDYFAFESMLIFLGFNLLIKIHDVCLFVFENMLISLGFKLIVEMHEV